MYREIIEITKKCRKKLIWLNIKFVIFIKSSTNTTDKNVTYSLNGSSIATISEEFFQVKLRFENSVASKLKRKNQSMGII